MSESRIIEVTEDIIKEAIRARGNLCLSSTQTKICLPIIHRISNKMLMNVYFESIKVHENAIIDGHHRYISSLVAKFELECVPSVRNSIKEDVDWGNVEFVNEDWDTEAKIKMLNERDAKRSSINIKEFEKI